MTVRSEIVRKSLFRKKINSIVAKRQKAKDAFYALPMKDKVVAGKEKIAAADKVARLDMKLFNATRARQIPIKSAIRVANSGPLVLWRLKRLQRAKKKSMLKRNLN